MFGKTKGIFFDLVGTFDPRVVPTSANKGTYFRFVPTIGNPETLVKADDGLTINWVSVGGGGGGVYTGSNLGMGEGVFSAVVANDFQFKSLVAGTGINITSTATEITIENTGGGGVYTGSNLGAGEGVFSAVVANDFQFKSLIGGSGISITSDASEITITSTGSVPTGDPNTLAYFDGAGNLADNVKAVFTGSTNSMALAWPSQTGTTVAIGNACLAFGLANDTGSVAATGDGSLAHGQVDVSSSVATNSLASYAFGYGYDNSSIGTYSTGALAFGVAESLCNIGSFGPGCFAGGYSSQNSSIYAFNFSSFAYGYANTNSLIRTNNQGSFAIGYASVNSTIRTSGIGGFSGGVADTNATIDAAQGSFVYGTAFDSVNLVANAISAQCFGINNTNNSYNSMYIGRYAVIAGTSNSWVNTDPLFVAGNGTSFLARSNAYQLDKDGKITTTGSHRNTATRLVSADTTLSARTDRVLYVDTASATGNVNVTFPVGENGLEFYVKDSGGQANINNILFVASGGNSIEATADITNARGTRHFQFYSGTWYVLNLP